MDEMIEAYTKLWAEEETIKRLYLGVSKIDPSWRPDSKNLGSG